MSDLDGGGVSNCISLPSKTDESMALMAFAAKTKVNIYWSGEDVTSCIKGWPHNKKLKGYFVVVALAGNVTAEEKIVVLSGSDINQFRYILSGYKTPGVQKIATIATSALESPCTKGIWFDPVENAEAYAMTLAGVISGKNLEERLETDSPPP